LNYLEFHLYQEDNQKIEVTFEVDANGIMNVSAKDETSGKHNKITIKNEKGRLSEEEIQNMLKKAEEMKKQDEEQLGKVNAKNGLESYLFAVKNTMGDKNLEGKIPEEDKGKVLSAVEDGLKWMSGNTNATKEEYEKKQKEIEEVAMPILQKLQGGMPQGGMPEGFPGGFPQGGNPGNFEKEEKQDSKPKFDDLDVD